MEIVQQKGCKLYLGYYLENRITQKTGKTKKILM